MPRYTIAEFIIALTIALCGVVLWWSWLKGQSIAATIFTY